MKFNEYKHLDLTKIAEEILAFWKAANIFEQSIASREGAIPFVFLKDRHLPMECLVFTT